MNLLVLGAAGATGRAVVDEALAAGHDVTAVAVAGARVPGPHERLEVLVGHATDQDLVDEAVVGKDVVVSVVEAVDRRPSTVCSDVAGAVAVALLGSGSSARLVGVSSSRVDPTGLPPGRRAYEGLIIRRRFHNPINDLLRMEHELRTAEGLDWTVVRPMALVDGPATGTYRVAVDGHVPGGRRLSRGDLGHYLARHLDDADSIGRTVQLAY